MIYQYKYKFYLNANHYIKINNKKGENHSHCFEIIIDIASQDNVQFTKFDEIEKRIDELLKSYQNKLLNEIPPFDTINPTIENICEYFQCTISKNLSEIGWLLLTIEMSETPSRSYILNVVEEINETQIDDNLFDIEFLNEDLEKLEFDIIESLKLNENSENEKNIEHINLEKDEKLQDDYDFEVPEELMKYDIEVNREWMKYDIEDLL